MDVCHLEIVNLNYYHLAIHRFLASVRIPGSSRDTYESYPSSNHAILQLGGRMFAFHAIDDDGNGNMGGEIEYKRDERGIEQ
tara:strand:+ start:624 stop:869 length:246 start_codon:yes stop_codon:yes gene_type:complete